MVRPAWTARFSSGAHINLGCKPKTKFKDLIELMVDVDLASPRGGVGPSHLHKRCHRILFSGCLAGVRGRGWLGRRLCRPPAG